MRVNPVGYDQSRPTIEGILSGRYAGQLMLCEGMSLPFSLASPQPKGLATVSNATLSADGTIDLNPYQ